MKIVKNVLLCLLVAFYLFMGIMHLTKPEQYFAMMPLWLPTHGILILMSGIIEIVLALLLMPLNTRTISAKLIIAMLIVFFFAIHLPETISYYKTGNDKLLASIIRLPIQFLFIAWAWIFAKKPITS